MVDRRRGRPQSEILSPPQRRVLDAISAHVSDQGMAPTLRELAEQLELAVGTVHRLVGRLERNGYVARTEGKSRSLTLLRPPDASPLVGLISIPILGVVVAGNPLFAPENILGELQIDRSTIQSGRHFALRVSGSSMIDAGIQHGDLLIVRQQPLANHHDIVVALINDDSTVKRLHHRDGEIKLLPENKRFKPVTVQATDDFRIIGKVVAVRSTSAN